MVKIFRENYAIFTQFMSGHPGTQPLHSGKFSQSSGRKIKNNFGYLKIFKRDFEVDKLVRLKTLKNLNLVNPLGNYRRSNIDN